MAFGIGSDGYMRWQQEVAFGTAVTTSMTDLPVTAEGSLAQNKPQNIDNGAVVFSRTFRTPGKGREINDGTINMDTYPSIFGEVLHFLVGNNSSATTIASVFDHVFLAPAVGESGLSADAGQPKAFTLQQAIAEELSDQYAGSRLSQMTITGNNEGNVNVTLTFVSKAYTTDVARVATFSLPADLPYKFSNVTFSMDAESEASIDLCLTDFELVLNMNLDIERFCLGDNEIDEPRYNARPEVTGTFTLRDGEQKFVDFARAHENISMVITMLSEDNIPTTSTPFSTVFELPGGRIDPEIEVPTTADRIQDMAMSIDFKYGGTTTNSTEPIMFEIRHRDGTTSYT